MATTSPLRQRMIEDMTIRNLSQATQQSYIYAVRKFSRHFGRSPDRLGIEDVRAYQLHLIAQKRSWSHINQTACALRFFYGVTLGRQEAFERIVSGREPEKLSPVLSPEEIARFLEAVAGLRNRVALTADYGAGLRIGEVDPEQRDIVNRFSNPRSRLLVTALQAAGPAGGEVRATVEVTHEALIRHWPTLRDWVRANRENLRARAAILRAKGEWVA